MKAKHCSAVTLVELLVVIAVLSALAALIFPVFAQAKAKAQQATCQSNLRQIGMAVSMYAQDFDGAYPPVAVTYFTRDKEADGSLTWRELLKPYLQVSFLTCPSRALPGVMGENAGDPKVSGYALNDRINQTINQTLNGAQVSFFVGVSEPRLRFPALTVLACDARSGITSIDQPDTVTDLKAVDAVYLAGLEALILTQPAGAGRHSGGANYAFGDGHVKWHRASQLHVAAHCDGTHPGFGL